MKLTTWFERLKLPFVAVAVDVRVRLATGELLRSLVANDGSASFGEQGTPVAVELPPDGLRILAG